MKNSTVGLIVAGIFALITVAYGFYVILFHIPTK